MATVNQAITNKGSGPQNRRFALVLVRCFGRYGSRCSMRSILILLIFLTSCATQNDRLPSVDRLCNFDEKQKEIAWSNVVNSLIMNYPEHSKYCEINEPASSQTFNVVSGECRVYLGCTGTVEGHMLSHGDWVVTINEATQEVIEFHDVTW